MLLGREGLKVQIKFSTARPRFQRAGRVHLNCMIQGFHE